MHSDPTAKSSIPLPTLFAAATRATPEEVEALYRSIDGMEILRAILDAMPDCVMVLNRHRQIVFGNRAVDELAAALGKKPYLGLRPGELLSCHQAAEAEGGCGTGEACRTCGAVIAILHAVNGRRSCQECRIAREPSKEPQVFDFRVWATPFLWQGEACVLFVAANIADEKRRRVLERIFFHDIMNTAGVISTMTEMLVHGYVEADTIKSDLSVASNTLVHEIKSQRILLAAESSELAVDWAPLNAREFLEALIHTFRNHEVAAGKRIELRPDRSDCVLLSDYTLLSRVLGNLLKNALEASTAGQAVTVGWRHDGERVTFTCHNELAMPRDVQLQVFQRSFSTKGRDRGIGTYSVRLLTEKYLHGKVTFRSDERHGTEFSVELPLRPPEPSRE